VLSCGIILLRNRRSPNVAAQLPIETNDIEMLMIRRKDSMSYTEFMRGKYDPDDSAYVARLLSNMTCSELQHIKSNTFETLWLRMWNFSDRHEQDMEFAKEKFSKVAHLIANSTSEYSEPEWGFPKGRRFRCESDQSCAEREFHEETNIPRSAYLILNNVSFQESFLGTNGIPYEHKYFVAVMVSPLKFNLHQKFTNMQKREISGIGWKSLHECAILTRPHYTGRELLLYDLAAFITKIEVWIPPREDFQSEDNEYIGS
jgi:8-oxo-dGTP pyrophosphatase MutT (NUDIX family)